MYFREVSRKLLGFSRRGLWGRRGSKNLGDIYQNLMSFQEICRNPYSLGSIYCWRQVFFEIVQMSSICSKPVSGKRVETSRNAVFWEPYFRDRLRAPNFASVIFTFYWRACRGTQETEIPLSRDESSISCKSIIISPHPLFRFLTYGCSSQGRGSSWPL